MSEHELEILLMGYVDGELDEADRRRVEEALASDPALQAELAEMRRLKDLTAELGIDDKTDAELKIFWGSVYNRMERRIGWMLLLAGVLGLGALGLFFFLDSDETHWMVKVLTGCMGLGALILLWSVWRERMLVLPHDRYSKEIHR
ncbi:MAG: anti-sigma factor family protein [Planctomycetota bacterium]|jgi:ferric-dicitrate binding protein FerR (iron transport regulator)